MYVLEAISSDVRSNEDRCKSFDSTGTPSMTGKVEYLERYSVAPSPSRDYYGLKILRDEVILCIWKISHGPHKTPILRRSKFFEFDQDKALQDDISRTFGDHFVNYVKSIARGKGNTLLTLPRSSIRRIVGYLKLKDIVNLSTLSRIANVVFNDNLVWEALYRRHERFKIGREEREYAMAYGWKQTFKEKQMVLSAEHRKTPGSMMKRVNSKTQQGSTRSVSGPLKVTSKVSSSSISGETTRSTRCQIPQKIVTTNLIRSLENSGTDDDVKSIQVDKKVNASVKKIGNTKIRQMQNANSLRKEKSNLRVVESKHNIREVFSDSMTATQKDGNTQRGKLRKSSVSTKISNSSVKITDKGKVGDSKRNASGKSHFSSKKSMVEVPIDQRDRNKSQSKIKSKTKKLTQTKSTILNADESFLNNTASVLGNENYELAYLIEESLKKLRSPRTVFDYDFSYLEGSKTLVNATKKKEAGKPGNKIEGSKVRDQGIMTLDRLSDNSDSLGTPSTDSVFDSHKQEHEEKKSKRSNDSKVSTVRSERIERVADFYETSTTKSPKKTEEETDDIKRPIPRGALNSIDIMKSLRSNNPATKSTVTSGKNLPATATKNRFAVKNTLNKSQWDQITDNKNN